MRFMLELFISRRNLLQTIFNDQGMMLTGVEQEIHEVLIFNNSLEY